MFQYQCTRCEFRTDERHSWIEHSTDTGHQLFIWVNADLPDEPRRGGADY